MDSEKKKKIGSDSEKKKKNSESIPKKKNSESIPKKEKKFGSDSENKQSIRMRDETVVPSRDGGPGRVDVLVIAV